MMPLNWQLDVVKRLRAITNRPIRVRPHPGNGEHKRPLVEDLGNACAVVIWSSSAGVQALVAGVPVVCEAPWWICKSAAADAYVEFSMPAGVASLLTSYRLAALRRLAWAQWNVDEIASGEPFRYLLSDTRQAQSAAVV
jgi:hypothetical protein